MTAEREWIFPDLGSAEGYPPSGTLTSELLGTCWTWPRSLDADGYGKFGRGGVTYRAHRWFWEQFRGAIPAGLTIDHLCRNRACVNPWHMEVVTNRENILRGDTLSGRNKRKTHCKRGHPFDDANTLYVGRVGVPISRRCRTCAAEVMRERRRRESPQARERRLANMREYKRKREELPHVP